MPTLDDLVERAFDAIEEGDSAAALEAAVDALAMDADDVDANHIAGTALLDLGDAGAAARHLERVTTRDPQNADAWSALGEALFETLRFDESRRALERALELDRDLPDTYFWLALSDERLGHDESAQKRFAQATKLDPERFGKTEHVTEAEFQKIVEEAIEELPETFRKELRNLAILIDPIPDGQILEGEPPFSPCILGLHVGHPLPDRGSGRSGDLPNTIHLFQRNIERAASDPDELVEQIRITLMHEIGHYLGLDEDEVDERGLS